MLQVPPRTYDQLCPVAAALDLVGDRWTLLLLRDLLWHGPLRFGELEDRNPGLSTSLLSARLRDLTGAGVVERIGTGGAGRYRVTEAGLRARPVIDALYEFGGPLLAGVPLRPEMLAYVVRATALRRRRELLELHESATVRLEVDGCETVVVAGPGRLETTTADGVDATMRCTQEAFVGIVAGALTLDDALPAGSATIEGDPAAVRLVVGLLGRTEG